VKEKKITTKFGVCIIRDEGEKLMIEVPKPKDLTLEEMDKPISGETDSFCEGCQGVITATAAFWY
jgi:hypothetical protein